VSKHIFLVLLFALLICPQSYADQQKCMPIIATYSSWNHQQLPIENIPWNRFTHLALIFALPMPDGSLSTKDIDPLVDLLSKAAHEKGKKLFISIGGAAGYGNTFQQISQSPEKLKQFTQSVANYVQQHQLDGIDIDWEYWTKQVVYQQGGNDPIESKLLITLLAELRKQLPEKVALTTSVFAGYWSGEEYLSEIQNYVDYVVLMSYDFTGSWPASPIKHHADFDTFKKSITFLTDRGFVREKIVVGIPFYGKEFVNGKNKKVIDKSYREVVPLVHSKKQSIDSGKLDNLYYETPKLVTQKSHYILDNSLAGVLFFELTQDLIDSPDSLSLASNRVISADFCESKQ